METAPKILITGGTLVILVSLLLGVDISRRRQRQTADEVRSWLTAHTTILFQGFMMLGLSLAAVGGHLADGLKITAAWLVFAGAMFSTLANIVNASQKVTDQFAERSLGLRLNQLQAVVVLPGVAILLIGMLRAV